MQYGKQTVPISAEEENHLKYLPEKDMQVIGFVGLDQVPRYTYMKVHTCLPGLGLACCVCVGPLACLMIGQRSMFDSKQVSMLLRCWQTVIIITYRLQRCWAPTRCVSNLVLSADMH